MPTVRALPKPDSDTQVQGTRQVLPAKTFIVETVAEHIAARNAFYDWHKSQYYWHAKRLNEEQHHRLSSLRWPQQQWHYSQMKWHQRRVYKVLGTWL